MGPWLCFFSSRRRHTRFDCDWSSDVCSSDLVDDGERSAGGGGGDHGTLCLRYGPVGGGDRCRRRVSRVRGRLDRKSVVEGKRGDLGGCPIIKKKKRRPTAMQTRTRTRRCVF